MEYPYGEGSALLVVGLGNPGEAYEKTKHNIGFMVVDQLAQHCQIRWRRGKGSYLLGTGRIANRSVIVCKPMTYMNKSGDAVKQIVDYQSINMVENLLVIGDDLNLDLGRLRFRRKGSDGGNLGLRSIIKSLQSTEFSRLRVGIRTPSLREDYPDYVLSPFKKKEYPLVKLVVDTAQEAVTVFIEKGIESTMNFYNNLIVEE